MNRRTFLTATAAILLAPTPLFADDDPATFLTAIYERVAAGKGESGGSFMLEAQDRAPYFSTALRTLWAAAEARTKPDEVGPVDFDPLANSQDPLVKAFVVKVESRHATTASVAVSLSRKRGPMTPTRANTLHFTLVREGNRWLIDNINGMAGDQAWDFRDMLKSHGR